MAEILDPDGVWTSELLELMLPVAIVREAEQTANFFGAALAAVSSLGGKEAVEAFEEGIKTVKEAGLNAARAARGIEEAKPEPKKYGATPAEKMGRIARQMGLGIPKRGKKNKQEKKAASPGDTRVHKPKK